MFEFDPDKSAANKAKYGIDFVEAQALWDGIMVTTPSNQAAAGEQRFLVLGEIGGKRWTAIVAHRNSMIRIISVRRSRYDEELQYEQACQDFR